MNENDIIEITRQANDAHRRLRHESLRGPEGGFGGQTQLPTFDAVFLALAFARAAGAAREAAGALQGFAAAVAEIEPPEWLQDAVTAHRGREVTAGQLWTFGGQGPSTKGDARQVGQWLRRMGYTPTRKGGRILFKL